jgi:ABC-type iron transport system FetAB ATPase subunit
MSLVRDYNHLIDNNIHHTVFENLFSDQPKTYKDHEYDLNDPKMWHHVITADPTQTKAILQAQKGESYIIQGPPGTGKSQTITNLIADFVAQGKNVLFVCEKRAALDVVYHRLKQQGLDELCCYIHDSQSDKREFIKNLKATYEDFIKNALDLKSVEEERTALLNKIGLQLSLLREYHFTNALPSEMAGTEVRKLLERLIALKEHITVLPAQEMDWLPHYKEWTTFGETVQQLSERLEAMGAEPSFSDHPFSKVREALFQGDAPTSSLHRLLTEALTILITIDFFYQDYAINKDEWGSFSQLRELISDVDLLYPLA